MRRIANSIPTMVICMIFLMTLFGCKHKKPNGGQGTNTTPSWSVDISASSTSVRIDDTVALTATTNRDVSITAFFIVIFEDNTIIKTCGSGTTCEISSVVSSTPVTKNYVAKVAFSNGTNVQATSNSVSVTWTAPTTPTPSFTISLSSTSTSVTTGTAVTLTATTNRDVGPTEFFILIFEGNSIIETCGSGTTCSISVVSSTPATKTYTAKVARENGSSVQATSSAVSVTWSASAASTASVVTGETSSNGMVSITDPVTRRTAQFHVTDTDGNNLGGIEILYFSDGNKYVAFFIDPNMKFAPAMEDGNVADVTASLQSPFPIRLLSPKTAYAQVFQAVEVVLTLVDTLTTGSNIFSLGTSQPAILSKTTGSVEFCYTVEAFAAELGLQNTFVFGTTAIVASILFTPAIGVLVSIGGLVVGDLIQKNVVGEATVSVRVKRKIYTLSNGTSRFGQYEVVGRDDCSPTGDRAIESPDVELVLRWQSRADIDIHVLEPNQPESEEIFFRHKQGPGGGELEFDDICASQQAGGPEKVKWKDASLGDYRVRIQYFSRCQDSDVEGAPFWNQQYTLELLFEGNSVKTVSGTLGVSPRAKVDGSIKPGANGGEIFDEYKLTVTSFGAGLSVTELGGEI